MNRPLYVSRATGAELVLFSLVVLMFSGAPTSLYIRLFNYAPPLPGVALLLPVLLAMIVNIVLRFREALFGGIALWSWVFIALLSVASYIWSVSPADTFREAFVMLIVVLYLGTIAGLASWEELTRRAWRVCMGLTLFSVFLFVAVPNLGAMQEIYPGALVGPWYEKNATGQFFVWMTILSFARAAYQPQKAPFMVMMAFVSIGLIVLTQSTTALLAALAATALFFWLILMRRAPLVSLSMFGLTLIAAIPLVALVGTQGGAVLEIFGKSSTLTGRIPIWNALGTYSLAERPLLGHGYAAYWSDAYEYGRREYIFDDIGYVARHSHNSFIEMRLDLGWVGACLFAAAAIQAVVMSITRLRQSNGSYFVLPALFAALIIGFAEPSLVAITNLGGVFFVLILAKMTLTPPLQDRRSGWQDFLTRLQPKPA
jgi:O-antigen ligase